MSMFNNYDNMLTVDEACEALKIGHNTMYALLRSGKLKGFRCGRIWKIPRAAMTEYVLESANLSPKGGGRNDRL